MLGQQEDLDYEPDVLKFKQIWNQMKETTNNAIKKNPQENLQKPKKRADPECKKSVKPRRNVESKKQTILSDKYIRRNPKPDPNQEIEFETKPGCHYQNRLDNQKNSVSPQKLIQIPSFANETVELHQLKKAVEEKDHQLSLLRVSNTRNEDKLRSMQKLIESKEEKILRLEQRQRELLSKISSQLGHQKVFDFGQVEYENFRNDIRRILKMLQSTTEYQQFADLALDDNGIRFLHSVNEKVKTELDGKKTTKLHYCSCNKDFISESGLWVPEQIYSYGKQFLKSRNGEMTIPELQLLLYDLNKFWREREKRIINTCNSQKAKQVGVLKRKLNTQREMSK